MSWAEAFAVVVRTEIHERDWTQEEFSRRAGMCRENVARIEIGKHTPTIQTMERIARAFECQVFELVQAAETLRKEAV